MNINELQTELKASAEKVESLVTDKFSGLTDRVEGLEAKMNRVPMAGATKEKTRLGDYIGSSEHFKSFQSGNSDRVTIPLENTQFKALLDVGVDEYGDGGIAKPQRQPGIYAPVERIFSIRDLLPAVPCASNLVEYIQESSFTNNSGEQVVPGDTKSESQITLAVQSAQVATIAHFINVPKQGLDDIPALTQHLDNRLVYGLKVKEETAIIAGTGVIKGLEDPDNHVTFDRYPSGGSTYIDVLGAAITQLQLTDNQPNGIVLNPADWEVIKLLKTSTSEYVAGFPSGELVPKLWGLPVVISNSITAGGFIVGDFARGAILFDRQMPTVEFSRHHDSNFTKNIVTILAEERVALAVVRPTAFVFGLFMSST